MLSGTPDVANPFITNSCPSKQLSWAVKETKSNRYRRQNSGTTISIFFFVTLRQGLLCIWASKRVVKRPASGKSNHGCELDHLQLRKKKIIINTYLYNKLSNAHCSRELKCHFMNISSTRLQYSQWNYPPKRSFITEHFHLQNNII